MKHFLFSLILTALFSSIVFGENTSVQSEEAANVRHKRIYSFQHQVLPLRVLNSNGQFFSDLATGIPPELMREAERSVNEAFAKALELKAYPEKNAYVIIFPEPDRAYECYFALIKQEEDGLSCYVLEKGTLLFGVGTASRLCMWDKDGQQINCGSRPYFDLKTFVDEVLYDKAPDA